VLRIDTDGFGMYHVDVDHKALYEHVIGEGKPKPQSREPISIRQVKRILEWLDSHRGEVKLTDEMRARAYMEAKSRNGWSYREAEKVLGLSHDRLRRWAQKYNLVPSSPVEE
jgi:hypothetical protein